MDFSLAHFTDFNFAHFEIEESFGLIWAKLQNDRFHSQIFFFEYLKSACFKYGLYLFLILCITEVLRKFA